MNQILFYILVFISATFNLAIGQSADNTIYVPMKINGQNLDDFRELLETSTGNAWSIQNYTEIKRSGIYLKIENLNEFTTSESFHIESNGRNQLIITSSTEKGLIFGFYKHLRNLGFKFYLPDELYTLIPKLEHPYGIKMNRYDKPYLQIREFFGTGGFGSNNADPEMYVKKAWDRWAVRNGFGSDYQLSGHRGESFILDNYEILKKNPKWLTNPLSGNKHQDQLIKINYANQEALDFYTNWTLQDFRKSNFKLPPSNFSEFVSIEPSDGGGYANTNASISDQVFGAANAAAKKLDKLFPKNPNIGVNLYAYSSHAAPPSFELNPRVFVQIIPYQFQNIAFGPSFVKLWAAKAKRFGLYDYLNYPDLQFDLPGGITLDEVMKRLMHSVKNGSEGTTFESSYSKFSTGISLYIISRYMADGEADWQGNLNDLISDLYNKSSTEINALFHLFYRSQFNSSDLGTAALLLKKAEKNSNNKDVSERLNEIKIYLRYIDLVYQSRENNNTPEKKLIPLAEYAWEIYQTKIVHSYRIMQLVSYSFLNAPKSTSNYQQLQDLHVKWFPETPGSKSAWSSIPQSTNNSKLNLDFEAILKTYPARRQPTPIQPSAMLQAFDQSNLKPKRSVILGGSSLVRGYLGIYAEKSSSVTISYKIDGKVPSLMISSIDKNYTNDTVVALTRSSGKVSINIPQGETTIFFNAGSENTYRIETTINNGYFFFDGAPRGKMNFYKTFNDPYESYSYQQDVYPSFFFLPNEVKEVTYKVQSNQLNITSPVRGKINTTLSFKETSDFEFRKFNIEKSESNKIWKAVVGGNFNYSFLNIPDRYYFLVKK